MRLYSIGFPLLAHVRRTLSGLSWAWLTLRPSIVAQIYTLVQNVHSAVVEGLSRVGIIADGPLTFLETSRA